MWKILVGVVAARDVQKKLVSAGLGIIVKLIMEDKLQRFDKVRRFAVSCLIQVFETVKMN
jgi:hypothetical protein